MDPACSYGDLVSRRPSPAIRATCRLAFASENRLYMRRLSETVSVPIRGSQDATQPFFSPDGRWLGFYQRSEFKKVAVTGGAPVSLATTVAATGASWTDDDRILVGRGPDGIWQVPADGGAFEPLTTVEDGEAAGHPQLLPGGEWLLYTLRPGDATDWRDAQVVAQSLGTGERAVLIRGGSGGRYVPTGHLVYVLDGTLWGVAFELETRTVTSEPVALADLADNPRSGALHLGLSTDGVLAYLAGAAGPATGSVLGWVDRSGEMTPLTELPAVARAPRLSPDADRAVFHFMDTISGNLWLYDFARGSETRLTYDGLTVTPAWTPDGSRVTFGADRGQGLNLYQAASDGAGETQLLLETTTDAVPGGWSPDGDRLVFYEIAPESRDIRVLGPDGAVTGFLTTAAEEYAPRLSPDGRWVAG